jgi:O-acetyl-ADP-ribose deacetylase (regulator of RNase III)
MSTDRTVPKTFGAVSVALVNDNIANREADVLVNAANNQLQMGGGVAAALRSRGGIEIHLEAIRHAPADIGSVVRTAAGKLAARHVYHAVVIDYDVSKGTSAADVAAVVRNLVRQAAADRVTSMAMPLFGAGVGGLSIETSLNTILEGLEAAAAEVRPPLAVEIVVWDATDFEQAAAVFNDFESREARQAEEDRLAEEALKKLLGE